MGDIYNKYTQRSVSPAVLDWTQDDGLNNPSHHLFSTITLLGIDFHVEAIAVKRVDGFQEALDPTYEKVLQSFEAATLPDGGWSTVKVGGFDYVVFLYPFSS